MKQSSYHSTGSGRIEMKDELKKGHHVTVMKGVIFLAVVGVIGASLTKNTFWSFGPASTTAENQMMLEHGATSTSVRQDTGSWVLVLRQTVGTNAPAWFNQAIQAAGVLNQNDPTNPNYMDLTNLNQYADASGVFEFKMTWPGSGQPDQVWKQTSNPWTSATVSGYQAVTVPFTTYWHGLQRSNYAVLDGEPSGGNWWYAVGSFQAYGSGIPGPFPHTVPKVELYVKSAQTGGGGGGAGSIEDLSYTNAKSAIGAAGCPNLMDDRRTGGSPPTGGYLIIEPANGCQSDVNQVVVSTRAFVSTYQMRTLTISSAGTVSCSFASDYGVPTYGVLHNTGGGCDSSKIKIIVPGAPSLAQSRPFPSHSDLVTLIEGGSCPQQLVILSSANSGRYNIDQLGGCGVAYASNDGPTLDFYRRYENGVVLHVTLFTNPTINVRLVRFEKYILGVRHPRSDVAPGVTHDLKHFAPDLTASYPFTVATASFELVY